MYFLLDVAPNVLNFRYNAVFSMACFKAYSFRMRAKSDTYNDETRVKHTVVAVDNINPEEYCRSRTVFCSVADP